MSDLAVRCGTSRRLNPHLRPSTLASSGSVRLSQLAKLRGMHPDVIRRMIDNLSFISDHFRAIKKADKVLYFYSV